MIKYSFKNDYSELAHPRIIRALADFGSTQFQGYGAIEATGHKICSAKGIDGKVTVPEIDEIVKQHCDEHMVKPRLVYISNSTEIGSIWGKPMY
jgi:threonine aldolase